MTDYFDEAMLNPTNAKMTMFYGISALCISVITMIWWFTTNQYNAVAGLYWGFIIHQIVWWPVGIMWIALALWDSKWTRKIF